MTFPGTFSPTLFSAAAPANPSYWAITIVTTASPQSVTVEAAGNTLDYVWGDGDSDLGDTTASITHEYATAGTYELRISGTATRIWFDNALANAAMTDMTKIWGITGLTSALSMFEGCSNLASPPTGLFDEFTGILSFESTFRSTDFTTIPSGIFDTNVSATTFELCFRLADLTTVPTDLFRYNTLVTTFEGCFNFGDITAVPTDLFRYNTLVTTFDSCFRSCNFSTVPTDIFRYNTAVTQFNDLFEGTSSLTSLPADLFRYNTSAVNFDSCFHDCSGLTALPVNLMDYATSTDCTDFCAGCTSLTTSNASTWDISGLSGSTDMARMFEGVTLDTSDYDALLIGWEGSTHNTGVTFDAGSSIYTSGGAAETARTTLDVTDTWTITDGGGT